MNWLEENKSRILTVIALIGIATVCGYLLVQLNVAVDCFKAEVLVKFIN